jgi:hypothetical protein
MNSGGALQGSEIAAADHGASAPIIPEKPPGAVDILFRSDFAFGEFDPIFFRNVHKEGTPVMVPEKCISFVELRDVVVATIGLVDVVGTNIESRLLGDDG